MIPGRLLGRIAAEETGRYFRRFNKRVLLFLLVAILVAALLIPPILSRGVTPDVGLYRAEVTPQSPLRAVLAADHRFETFVGYGARFNAAPPEADLFVQGTSVFYQDTPRGRAAVHDLAEFARRYFDDRLSQEGNQTAAFPVRVNVVYQPRAIAGLAGSNAADGEPTTTSGPFTSPNRSIVLAQPGEQQRDLLPGNVDPPFPMRSLLLTFFYLIPLNFIGQYYAGSLLAERTRSRGLLLLSAPVTGPGILAAKTLPYAATALVFALGTTLYLRASLLALVAVLPILAFFLAATAFAALVARSYRELTFLLTTMSVALSTYLFLPAIFVQVHAIAYISPISVVAAELRHETVPWGSLLYSITPLTLAALVFAAASNALYREETLFAPRGVLAKLLDATARLARNRLGFAAAGIVVLPFVFGAELFVLAFAVTLPLKAALGLFLVGVAVVEELFKALPSAAHARRAAHPSSPWIVGPLVGVGFFLGEKASLLFSLVGLDLVPLGTTLLHSYGIAASFFVVFAPLLLHVATATLSAVAARGRWLRIGLPLAVLLHVAYNGLVIRLAT